jgi:hypothetical protein
MKKEFIMRLIMILIILFSGSPSLAHEICGEPPPVADESLRAEIEGKAKLLSRLIGETSLSGSIETAREEIFSKYPDAELSRSNAYFEYQMCVLIMNDKAMTTQQKVEELKKVKREFGKPVKSSSIDVSGRWIGTMKMDILKSATPCELLIQQNEKELVVYLKLGTDSNQPKRPYKGNIDGNSIQIKGSSKYEEWYIDAVIRGNHMDGKLITTATIDPTNPKKYTSDLFLDRKY